MYLNIVSEQADNHCLRITVTKLALSNFSFDNDAQKDTEIFWFYQARSEAATKEWEFHS